jgi:hypothetical protein
MSLNSCSLSSRTGKPAQVSRRRCIEPRGWEFRGGRLGLNRKADGGSLASNTERFEWLAARANLRLDPSIASTGSGNLGPFKVRRSLDATACLQHLLLSLRPDLVVQQQLKDDRLFEVVVGPNPSAWVHLKQWRALPPAQTCALAPNKQGMARAKFSPGLKDCSRFAPRNRRDRSERRWKRALGFPVTESRNDLRIGKPMKCPVGPSREPVRKRAGAIRVVGPITVSTQVPPGLRLAEQGLHGSASITQNYTGRWKGSTRGGLQLGYNSMTQTAFHPGYPKGGKPSGVEAEREAPSGLKRKVL